MSKTFIENTSEEIIEALELKKALDWITKKYGRRATLDWIGGTWWLCLGNFTKPVPILEAYRASKDKAVE